MRGWGAQASFGLAVPPPPLGGRAVGCVSSVVRRLGDQAVTGGVARARSCGRWAAYRAKLRGLMPAVQAAFEVAASAEGGGERELDARVDGRCDQRGSAPSAVELEACVDVERPRAVVARVAVRRLEVQDLDGARNAHGVVWMTVHG